MSDCSHPCGGACCKRFSLNVPDFEKRMADARSRLGTPDETEDDRDVLYWLPHVHPWENDAGAFYCDLLDWDTGRCTAYDQRPRTCREFPKHEATGVCGKCQYMGRRQLPVFTGTLEEPPLLTPSPVAV